MHFAKTIPSNSTANFTGQPMWLTKSAGAIGDELFCNKKGLPEWTALYE
jgi:hypothetical protein